jgi:hypothetical protein
MDVAHRGEWRDKSENPGPAPGTHVERPQRAAPWQRDRSDILACVADHGQSPPVASAQPPLVTPPGAALDPMVALATSVHASPGVYALLLGSGVSSAAGVPTGWQVVTDLVRKAAAIQRPDDPDAVSAAEEWWSQYGDGHPLGYSALLNSLAQTPAARQALLAGYFEPDDTDRQEGRKVPSAAHHAIARLAARGAIRVVLTTNFDRLTERALEEAGVPPQVLHRPDQLAGATPLAHARITVIKLHGDYADLDQRNTADELADYPQALRTYLSRVLDEYGLIVCGWSAEWDSALVHVLEEVPSRRYPLFWSSYGRPGESAQRLIAQHGAVTLHSMTADDLFTGLLTRLEALDRLTDPPITADMAVQRLKRALPDPTRRIELTDLVNREIQWLAAQTADTTRHPLGGVPFADQLIGYEEETATAARLLATGVFDDDGTYDPLWIRSLQRLMSARRPFAGPFNAETEAMRHYPALLCLWAMGISTILANREDLLARLLLEPTWTSSTGAPKQQPAVYCLPPNRIVAVADAAPGGRRWLYPQSQHIRAASRDTLSQIEPDDDAYRAACDMLEYLASLISMDKYKRNGWPWAGEFMSRGDSQNPGPGALQRLAKGGAFGGTLDQSLGDAELDLSLWITQHRRF